MNENYELQGFVVCPECGDMFHRVRKDEFKRKGDPRGTWFELLPHYGPGGENWSSFPENDEAIRGSDLYCPGCGGIYTDIRNRIAWYGCGKFYGFGKEGYRLAKSAVGSYRAKERAHVTRDAPEESKAQAAEFDIGGPDSWSEFYVSST